ncbi:chemotaxis protein CheW [Bacterioplanoides pacificum]|uniref:Chemotaxis protein CheW n=1 Tax=Bacterioplanoides pacificum TaxID=1171596 RepID=A0ABV7VR44_9GAMM
MQQQPWLEFVVADERYAVPVAQVIEILSWRECDPVPGADIFIRGIINFRGNIVPVVDMHQWLHKTPLTPQEDSKILTMMMAGEMIGVAVDGVEELIYPQQEQRESIVDGDNGLTETCYYHDRLIALFDWQLLQRLFYREQDVDPE